MANPPRISIVVNPMGQDCRLFINDEEQQGVASFTLVARAGEVTRLQVEYVAIEGEVEGKSEVEVPNGNFFEKDGITYHVLPPNLVDHGLTMHNYWATGPAGMTGAVGPTGAWDGLNYKWRPARDLVPPGVDNTFLSYPAPPPHISGTFQPFVPPDEDKFKHSRTGGA